MTSNKNIKKRDAKYFKREPRLNALEEKVLKNQDLLLKILGMLERDFVDNKINIPVSIFKKKYGASQILCRYLKDSLGMKFSEIAKLLNRDQRTIWVNYNSLKKKIIVGNIKDAVYIPVDAFSNRDLSIFESLVYFLKEKGYRNLDISKMLGRDQRNIGTAYFRIKKKMSRKGGER